MFARHLVILALSCILVSCEFVERVLYSDDEVVAAVGKSVLRKSDVEALISDGLSPEDSAGMAKNIIQRWRLQHLMLRKAERELPSREKNLTRELEDYRRSLLVYRYEQMYVADRLDTSVSDIEVEEYYENNKAFFLASAPLLRGFFLKMSSDSPNLQQMKYKLRSLSDDDTEEMMSLSMKVSYGYLNFYDTWVSAYDLVGDFHVTMDVFERMIMQNSFLEAEDEGMTVFLRIWGRVRSGEVMPLDYCSSTVKERILNRRKKDLLDNLEQDLLRESVLE